MSPKQNESSWKKTLSHDPTRCAVCKQTFESVRSLHAHLKKHSLSISEYYEENYPRKNLATGEPISFISDVDVYFDTDFTNRAQLIKWCKTENKEKVEEYILAKLEKRIKDKNLKFAPCSLQLFLDKLPNIDIFKDICGSYESAAKALKTTPIYSLDFDSKLWNKDYSSQKIWIDTREQKPYSYKKQDFMSLKIGDYCSDSKNNKGEVYVDRKSAEDFKGTMTTGFDRFEREILRAKEFNFHLFVVVEADITTIERDNLFGPHKYNMKFVFHNMKELINKYPDTVQFVFAKNRTKASILTQKILSLGKFAVQKDIQFFIQKGLINDLD